MKSVECFDMCVKFDRLMNDTDNEQDRARFANLKGIYHDKYVVALNNEIADRTAKFEARILAKSGNLDEWLTWAYSLYQILSEDTKLVVRSNAKDWDKSWTFVYEIDCLEKIEQLIGYKVYDHFVREA